MTLTIGSLFSGIGGLELGLERATGARTVWQVENDPFCRRVLQKHWPKATLHDDVVLAENLPFVDIICGGFPCQDISVAGDGAGIEHGARSGLWREFARIVGETKPRIVVVENVAALAARGLSRVLRDLADLGFMGTWDVVTAAEVGAPHLRRRLFVVAAHPERIDVREQSWWRSGACWTSARESRFAGAARETPHTDMQRVDVPAGRIGERVAVTARVGEPEISHSDGDGCNEGRACHPEEGEGGRKLDRGSERKNVSHAVGGESEHANPDMAGNWWSNRPAPPAVRRMDDGISQGLDRPRRRRPANDRHRLHALGNAVVPQVAEVIGRVVNQVFRGET